MLLFFSLLPEHLKKKKSCVAENKDLSPANKSTSDDNFLDK